MIGPTILTTAALPARRCWVCGDPAVAGTGVAVARWWCLTHLPVGLADTAADLAIAGEMQGLVRDFSEMECKQRRFVGLYSRSSVRDKANWKPCGECLSCRARAELEGKG